MKSAILLHGTTGSDKDYFWFGDTKDYLVSHGYTVWWPLLPHTDNPTLEETREYIEANMPDVNEETIIIGHSSSCPLILNLLQSFKVKIKQAVLVSGYYVPQPDGRSSMLPDSFGWDAIKQHAEEIVIINSDNDPWGCDDKQAKPIAEKLNAKFILAKGQGHMGSGTFNQPYREFKLLKDLLKV